MSYNLIVFGTRPELLKLIPLVLEIRKRNKSRNFKLLHTGQHKELVEELFAAFNIYPDVSLPISNNNSSIPDTLSQIIKAIQDYVDEEKDNILHIIAQGDTTTCLAAAMTAKFNHIPFAHIEAGLRTYDLDNPFPEEYFRQLITRSASIHFAPTPSAVQNLLNEKVNKDSIFLTGNTIVDLIDQIKDKSHETRNSQVRDLIGIENVLITCHRRENQNKNFEALVSTVIELAATFPELNFVWISHKNPFVVAKLEKVSTTDIPNLSVIDPVNIFDMILLYKSSKLVITDSGGIQEEAISFNVPTIICREKTERTEAIEIGNAILTGCSGERIKEAFSTFMGRTLTFDKNPFGDGRAAGRILDYFEKP